MLKIRITSVLAVCMALLAFAAATAAAPPKPAGGPALSPGYIPSVCTGTTFNAYASNFGYYYSKDAKNWISAPWCVPKWGNLNALNSGITKVKGTFTAVAVPTSNSSTYAPLTKSITWQAPGKVIAGCGNDDLTCTVQPTTRATSEWQWFEFKVSMPWQFYIDSPGSNCAGQHICAGTTTNAWGWVGVPPAGKSAIAGKVIASCQGQATCSATPAGVAGVRLAIKGKSRSYRAVTKSDGTYSVEVQPGTYVVTPSKMKTNFRAKSRKVKAKKAVSGVDFEACGMGAKAQASAKAIADGSYRLPGEYIADDEGCGKHRVFASVTRTSAPGESPVKSTIKIDWSSQLTCQGQFNPVPRTFTFTIKDAVPGGTYDGLDRATGSQGDIKIHIPASPDNVIRVVRLAGFEKRPSQICTAVYNRKTDPTKFTDMTLGGVPNI